MLSFAGLDPSVIQGTLDKADKLVKQGSPHLRETLMNNTSTSSLHNPVIYEYYMKKKSEGKAYRVALTHVAKKLVRIIYHLEKKKIKFDSNKLR
ncbi:MAG: transposase [Candidatus Izemoplasmatales bacterium]|nr:transposase [Candidatus Izemoplasmatales bacterium]